MRMKRMLAFLLMGILLLSCGCSANSSSFSLLNRMDVTVKRLASVCLWGVSSACSVSSATTAVLETCSSTAVMYGEISSATKQTAVSSATRISPTLPRSMPSPRREPR